MKDEQRIKQIKEIIENKLLQDYCIVSGMSVDECKDAKNKLETNGEYRHKASVFYCEVQKPEPKPEPIEEKKEPEKIFQIKSKGK